MTSILCANCELPISLGESFTQALEGRHQHLHPDQCIRLLRAELAEAVRLQEKYYGALQSSNAAAGRRGERIKELEAENAALREDKERLDAVDAQCPEGFDWSITWLDSGGWKIHPLRKGYLGDSRKPFRHFATAREAIDAARKDQACPPPTT